MLSSKRKILIPAVAAGLFLFPQTGSVSNTLTIDQAAKQMEEQDLENQKRDIEELDSDVQIYQSNFQDELEDIQDIQSEYQEEAQDAALELQIYQQLYNYWFLKEQYALTKHNLELAEEDLAMTEKRYKQGTASKSEYNKAKQNLNSQTANLANLEAQLNNLRTMLNQDLKQPLDQEIHLDSPAFKPLSRSDYDSEKVMEDVRKNDESLRLYRTIVYTYEDILDEIDDLNSMSGGTSAMTAPLQEQLDKVEQELVAMQTPLNIPVPAGASQEVQDSIQAIQTELSSQKQRDLLILQGQAAMLQTQINQIKAQDPDAAPLSTAKEELEEYYEDMLHNARIDLIKQEEHLTYQARQYEEQFEKLHKQIETYEENIDFAREMYQMQRIQYKNGMITQRTLEQSRLGIRQAQMQLLQAQKDYMLLKKEFELFKEGKLPGGTTGGF